MTDNTLRIQRQGAVLAYIVLLLLFLTTYLRGYFYAPAALLDPYNLSIVTGVAAYVIFMTQFLLSGRIRFLERIIGQDFLLGLHGFLGMSLSGVLALHGILKLTIFGPSLQSLLGIITATLFFALAPAAFLVLRSRGARKPNSPPYERTKQRHNLMAAAALFAAVHVQIAGTTYGFGTRFLTLIWAVIGLGVWFDHRYLRPRRRAEYRVTAVEERTNDVVAVTMEPVDADSRATRRLKDRRAGQFAYFSFHADGIDPEEHPFTIAAAPDKPVRITVRKLGDFTNNVSTVPVGADVRIDGPYGRFTLPTSKQPPRPVYLIAGGIGITPMAAMLNSSRLREENGLTLIWSVRNETDLSTIPEYPVWKELLSVFPVVYESRGFLNREILEEIVAPEAHQAGLFYLCGPPGFMNSVTNSLLGMGIRKNRLRSERFSW